MNFAKMKRKMFNKYLNEKTTNEHREKLDNWAWPIDEKTGKRVEIANGEDKL